jgi:hypothetical protein
MDVKLGVSQYGKNRVLGRISGPKREEVVGAWRRLHNKELHNLYTLPNFIWVIKPSMIRGAGHVACMDMRNSYNILVRKPEGKKLHRRHGHRWEDNIRMVLREIG